MEFRLATEADMEALREIRQEDLRKLHLSRIERQKQDKAEYFVVFKDEKPIGHRFINYDNKGYSYPILDDLFVKKEYRRQGIAKKIIIFSEKHIKEKGYDRVGIDAETDRLWLKEFYENMGYQVVGEPHEFRYILEDKDNKEVVEEVVHLVKKI